MTHAVCGLVTDPNGVDQADLQGVDDAKENKHFSLLARG
jgi:hypothetical protein